MERRYFFCVLALEVAPGKPEGGTANNYQAKRWNAHDKGREQRGKDQVPDCVKHKGSVDDERQAIRNWDPD